MNTFPRRSSLTALLMLLCGAVAAMNVGDAAPDFSRLDLAGHPLRLRDYRGKVVLLNFWASWCSPCLEEMPRFSGWQQQYSAQGLQIIGISLDDDAAPVKELLVRRPVHYPIILGDVRMAEAFGGVLGLPLTYLIDAQGHVAARYQGESDLNNMEKRIRALLSRLPH